MRTIMSPSSHEINGPRPSPLKIQKGSHTIQKPSSSSSTITTATTCGAHQRHQPVIIYTHSPKVIHTEARDFMALVQKLTGFTRDNNNDNDNEDDDDDKECEPPVGPTELPSSGSHHSSPPLPPHDHHYHQQLGLGFDNSFLSEIPLFTPNSVSEFFLSSPKVEGMKAFDEF